MYKKISFLGSGKMAEALISGILSSGETAPDDVIASDISQDRLKSLKNKYGLNITENNVEAVKLADIIFLSVKPQQSKDVLKEISRFSAGKLFISIMAGISLKTIEENLPSARVVRVMPNTPALVGKGVSAIAKGVMAKSEDLQRARLLLQNVGQVIIVEEDLIDAVTALSGSGPAYFYWLTETLIKAGIEIGLNKKEAEFLANCTFTGSAALLDEMQEDAETLRRNVTSPGGTTEAALKYLENNKTSETIIEAVKAAKNRSKELSKNS